MATQQMTRLPREDLFSGDYTMGDSMSDLQLWSQLVAKCQNTDMTTMGLPMSPSNRDTANEELSTVTEYFHQVEQHVRCRDRARRHSPPRALCATMDERNLDGMQFFIGGKLKIKGNMMLAMLTLSSEFADPFSTTQMILCHQESQRESHQCQTSK